MLAAHLALLLKTSALSAPWRGRRAALISLAQRNDAAPVRRCTLLYLPAITYRIALLSYHLFFKSSTSLLLLCMGLTSCTSCCEKRRWLRLVSALSLISSAAVSCVSICPLPLPIAETCSAHIKLSPGRKQYISLLQPRKNILYGSQATCILCKHIAHEEGSCSLSLLLSHSKYLFSLRPLQHASFSTSQCITISSFPRWTATLLDASDGSRTLSCASSPHRTVLFSRYVAYVASPSHLLLSRVYRCLDILLPSAVGSICLLLALVSASALLAARAHRALLMSAVKRVTRVCDHRQRMLFVLAMNNIKPRGIVWK